MNRIDMQIPVDQAQLPLWVEYVKALGTPVVALIAAFIAGGIAYRQWTTARNKLKLDLFDKRMEIYSLSVTVLESVRSNGPADYTAISNLEEKLHAARWLFNRDLESHLQVMTTDARQQLIDRPRSQVDLTEDDFARLLTSASQRDDFYLMKRRSLDKIFAPFLSLKH